MFFNDRFQTIELESSFLKNRLSRFGMNKKSDESNIIFTINSTWTIENPINKCKKLYDTIGA